MPTPLPMHREENGPHRGVVTVTLDQPGKSVVVLDEDLLRAIEAALRAVPADAAGLVLASSSSRVFVAGADLRAVYEWDDARLRAYLELGARAFGLLASFPFWTAAAINGAALGGGLEIAMHCDGLIGRPAAAPFPVGLPEAGLSICPGWGGTNLLPARTDPADAIERTIAGRTMTDAEARELGLFDAIAETADGLLATAKRWVIDAGRKGRPVRDGAPTHWIGRPDRAPSVRAALAKAARSPNGPRAAVLAAVEAGLLRGWASALESERSSLIGLRHTPEARKAIEAFFARSSAKK